MFPQAVSTNHHGTIVSGTVWLQFATQVLTRGYESPVWGKRWSRLSGTACDYKLHCHISICTDTPWFVCC